MKDFRVLLTERCNANCKNCFNKDLRVGKEMSYDNFSALCEYLHTEGNVTDIKIMGGEPTVHNRFEDCILIAQKNFAGVHIFTNSINEKIENIKLRENDSVIYNLECLPNQPKMTRFLLEQPGKRLLETQISSETDIETVKRKLDYIFSNDRENRIAVSLTLNCIEDIFSVKEILIEKWNEIFEFVNSRNVNFRIDHNIPYCFSWESGMKTAGKKCLCSKQCAGLITTDLYLRYCNQSHEILDSIIIDGQFVPFEIIENRLSEFYHNKMFNNSKKICRDCIFFERKCNGGCFIHKEIIKVDSIFNKTSLPLLR